MKPPKSSEPLTLVIKGFSKNTNEIMLVNMFHFIDGIARARWRIHRTLSSNSVFLKTGVKSFNIKGRRVECALPHSPSINQSISLSVKRENQKMLDPIEL